MRNYQPKKNNPYYLPHTLYMSMLYLVRDHERMKKQREDVLYSSPAPDGIPSSALGNPTEQKALKLAALGNVCNAVERALETIPPEYRNGVIKNVCNKNPYPITAGEATYRRYKYKLAYMTAKFLYLI